MRVVIAEDQFLLREGLVSLLQSHDVEVVAAVADSAGIEPAIDRERPDLALLDIRLPPTFTDEGLRVALRLRTRHPGFPVMLLSQHVEHLYVAELLGDGSQPEGGRRGSGDREKSGGVGYLLKDRVFDDVQFVTALTTVAGGGTVVDPQVVGNLMARQRQRGVLERLTPRELEVLGLMAEGHSNKVVAERLVVTEKAVARHINSLFAKLDLPSAVDSSRRVRAVLTYLRT